LAPSQWTGQRNAAACLLPVTIRRACKLFSANSLGWLRRDGMNTPPHGGLCRDSSSALLKRSEAKHPAISFDPITTVRYGPNSGNIKRSANFDHRRKAPKIGARPSGGPIASNSGVHVSYWRSLKTVIQLARWWRYRLITDQATSGSCFRLEAMVGISFLTAGGSRLQKREAVELQGFPFRSAEALKAWLFWTARQTAS
jgi:hypothetical protein